ncbi:unnamed protein product [Rotaria magnacalcarata]|uniref:Uncharacterized protein n=1 Tax=Rotaria magnacalcarata TaxID=392030 RepID=A0A816X116_9BILA|nr:unnamed protein product [Rotaria magnacalcarata]CAF2141174.1 unnamed protein product [Rotaria magnacalcarata]
MQLSTTIDFSRGDVDEKNGEYLANALQNNTALRPLSLRGENQIGDTGAEHLANVLREKTTLVELDLRRNIGGLCVTIGAEIEIRNNKSHYVTT